THTQPASSAKHVVEQSLDLARVALRAAGVIPADIANVQCFTITDQAKNDAEQFWVIQGLAEKRVVAIQPRAGAALKSWPIDAWVQLADAIGDLSAVVLLVGASADRAEVEEIALRMTNNSVAIACGQPLNTSAALYQRCALLVGPDSGAAHLAAAVGTRTVRLYGPAPVDVFGPW